MTWLDADHHLAFWPQAVDAHLADAQTPADVAVPLDQFRRAHPFEITAAIDPEVAERLKPELTGFVLFAIRRALDDHELSDEERRALRQTCRILRVSEGDMLTHHRAGVGMLLAREMSRLLEDDLIDPAEALHKVKLQELLGLSYDEFVDLTAPQVEAVLVRVLRSIDSTLGPEDLAAHYEHFRNIVAFFDTVYNMNPGGRWDQRGGYIYLLVNPAMPGIVKIGKTFRRPSDRVVELSGATGVPVPFEVLFDVQVLDAGEAERYVHKKLDALGVRVSNNREFFRVSSSDAVEAMLEARDVVGSYSADTNAIPDGSN